MNKQAQRRRPSRKAASTPKKRLPAPKPTSKPAGAVRFPEVEGKTLEGVELDLHDDEYNSIELRFEDKTALRFDLRNRLSVRPDLADWKTGNRREIKEWPRFHSPLEE